MEGVVALLGLMAVVLVPLLIIWIVLRNIMVGRRNQVQFAEGSIDAMLKQRFDLVPNLVAAVDRYMTHERSVLESVTQARAKAMAGPLSVAEAAELDKVVTPGIRTLLAVAENYPDLKASQNFLHLQASLNETEAQIAAARRAFNAAATKFNDGCGMFPLSVAAASMGLRPICVFSIPEAERQSPSVKALFS